MTPFDVNWNKKLYQEHSEQREPHVDNGPKKLPQGSTNGARGLAGRPLAESSSLMQSMFRSVSMMESPTPSTTASVRFLTSTSGDETIKTTTPLLSNAVPTFRKAQSSPPDVRSPVPSVWKVQTLRPVPIYYPMETTAITISMSLVSLRNQISDFLKHHSISSVYHDETGRVDCMTSRLLHFSVQLWKSDDDEPSGNDVAVPKVIVEIQRRQGCCIEMQRLRQELIQWLRHPNGTTEVPVSSTTVPSATPHVMPVHVLQQLVEQSTRSDGIRTIPALTIADCENAFRIAYELLNSSRIDERRLGLESLHILANARSVMLYLADYVSLKILTDLDLQSSLLDYFVNIEINCHDHKNNDDDDAITLTDHDTTLDYARGGFFGAMHILALKVLANALDTVAYHHRVNIRGANGSSFNGVRLNLSSPLWNHALQAMLYNMHIAHVRPLEACLSVRSLRGLHILFPEILKERLAFFDKHTQLDHSLWDARAFGRSHFSQLEHETTRFMNELGLAY
jgi:hypothetical protein